LEVQNIDEVLGFGSSDRKVNNNMNMDERIKRINELYHKAQEQGLTEEEKQEQDKLRKEYAASFRNNLRAQLENIVIERPDGTIETLKKRTDK